MFELLLSIHKLRGGIQFERTYAVVPGPLHRETSLPSFRSADGLPLAKPNSMSSSANTAAKLFLGCLCKLFTVACFFCEYVPCVWPKFRLRIMCCFTMHRSPHIANIQFAVADVLGFRVAEMPDLMLYSYRHYSQNTPACALTCCLGDVSEALIRTQYLRGKA